MFVDTIVRCTTLSSFPHKNRDTQSRRAILVEEDKGLRLHPYKSEILINKVFYISICVLGEVEEINKKELLQSKAPKTANLSPNLLLTSPGWTDRVCSEFSTAERRLGSKPLYPCEMKQDRRKAPSFI